LSNPVNAPIADGSGYGLITEVRVDRVSLDVGVVFNTVNGLHYVLEKTDDLTIWSPVEGGEDRVGTGALIKVYDEGGGTQPHRIYRVRRSGLPPLTPDAFPDAVPALHDSEVVRIASISLDAGVVFNTVRGHLYVVEKTDDLTTWSPIAGGENILGREGIGTLTKVYDEGGGSRPNRKYRARFIE
jgi:hypothetical protein